MKALIQGQLTLVLHAHLPYVRHPEHERFYEETWLFEALTECYLPLAWKWEEWRRDELPWRLGLTVTPTLASQLEDPLLGTRYRRHLESLLELGRKELDRTRLDEGLRPLAERAMEHLERCRSMQHPGPWWLGQIRKHQAAGNLEVLGCAATHALLPLLVSEPASIRAQLGVGLDSYASWLGRNPRGFWLPECGWTSELERPLLDAGVEWVVLETHGVVQGNPPPHSAIFQPIRTPGGLLVVGRDPASARQVWSREGGYPGDPRYREFHRDLGHDAEWDYVRPHLASPQRTFTGFKYHRITGREVPGESKQRYVPSDAHRAVEEHAAHFVAERLRLAGEVGRVIGRVPLMVAPYDAELFGHWWHEGPDFLDAVIRRIARPESGLQCVVPEGGEGIAWDVPLSMPAASTWGAGGYLGVWLDESNADMQTPLRKAGWTLRALVDRFSGRPVGGVIERLLRQAGRELLLAQASDWPFLVRMGTAGEYPRRRFQTHLANFHWLTRWLNHAVGMELDRDLESDPDLETHLAELEFRSPIFPDLNWRLWRSA